MLCSNLSLIFSPYDSCDEQLHQMIALLQRVLRIPFHNQPAAAACCIAKQLSLWGLLTASDIGDQQCSSCKNLAKTEALHA